MDEVQWLVLLVRVPAQPSRHRVAVWRELRRVGAVSQDDLEATLNCGVGMVALMPAEDVDRALATLDRFGVHAWVAGEVSVDEQRGGRSTWSASTRAGDPTGPTHPAIGCGRTLSPLGRYQIWSKSGWGVREQPPIG